jgi:hypothetical protein
MAERTPMTEDDLVSILRKEEQASQGYQDSDLTPVREKALDYYNRELYGDEQDGQSQVVTSEFQDAVESLMPGLMRVFTSSGDLVKFTPNARGEENWAAEASDYVPHVLMKQNPGFVIMSGLLKDAVMYRLSGVTIDLEDAEETRRVPVQGLPQPAIDEIVAEAQKRTGTELVMELVADPMPEPALPPPEAMAAMPPEGMPGMQMMMPAPVQTFSGTITVTRKIKRVVVDGIAPEDIRFTPSARDQDKASFLGFVKRVTSSDLVQMLMDKGKSEGEARDIVDDMRSERPISVEEAQRTDSAIINDAERNDVGDSERPLWVVVAYVRADANGDGISEMLRVVYGHAGGSIGTIIDQMEWTGPASIALGTPILMPHTIVGRSLFDQTEDLQRIGSVLTRSMLNNQYMVNNPRPVVSDQVNLDSLLDWTPGSPVRLKPGAKPGDNHVAWLQVPSITANVLAALEHQATVKENRTGVSRYNQGMDAESLNKTMGGLTRIMSASGQRQDLIAQTFAQTIVSRIYMLIYRAVKRAATGPVSYHNGKAFANCDPTQWPDEMAVNVNVAGITNQEQTLQHLMVIQATMEKLVALQGGAANGPYVYAENVANLAQAQADTLGYKQPGFFFASADKVAEWQPPAAGEAPTDPALLAAQAQIEIMRQAAAAEVEIKRQKAAADVESTRDKARADVEIAWFKAKQAAETERMKALQKADLATRNADHKAGLDALDTIADANRPAAPQPNGSLPQ